MSRSGDSPAKGSFLASQKLDGSTLLTTSRRIAVSIEGTCNERPLRRRPNSNRTSPRLFSSHSFSSIVFPPSPPPQPPLLPPSGGLVSTNVSSIVLPRQAKSPSFWELSRMIRRSCTLISNPHFGALPHAPRVMYPHTTPALRSLPACSEGVCALELRSHFSAVPHAPRVAYPQLAPSL